MLVWYSLNSMGPVSSYHPCSILIRHIQHARFPHNIFSDILINTMGKTTTEKCECPVGLFTAPTVPSFSVIALARKSRGCYEENCFRGIFFCAVAVAVCPSVCLCICLSICHCHNCHTYAEAQIENS